jgi:hypothetical protein
LAECGQGGRFYSLFPAAVPVVAAPVVAVIRVALPLVPRIRLPHPAVTAFYAGDFVAAAPVVEALAASVLTALAVTLVFVLLRQWLSPNAALWMALAFAFGTQAWSTASRGLWQHGPAMGLLVAAILLVRGARSWKGWMLAGFVVALSYTMRPSNFVVVLVFTAWVALRKRDSLILFLGGAAPVAAVFVGWNWWRYESVFSSYFAMTPGGTRPWEALPGTLVSPSRGLLVFVPAVAFSVYGMWVAWRTRWEAPLSRWLIVLVVLHGAVIVTAAPLWWGGHSFGPRLWTDVMPVMWIFLVPAWRSMEGRVVKAAFVAALLAGVAIHANGGLRQAAYAWNNEPANVDVRPERLWNWRDPQFLR